MSMPAGTAAMPVRARGRVRDALTWTWQVWRATTRVQWAWVLVTGLIVLIASLPVRLDAIERMGWQALSSTVEFLVPLYVTSVMFLGWTLVDAAGGDARVRRRRLIGMLFGAAALATGTAILSWYLAGSAAIWEQYAARIGKPRPSPLLILLAEYVNVVVVAGMAYAAAEVYRRRKLTQQALQATLGRQAALEQQMLESRLAAMQAQVEPRFLFDTLVDIEALYERDAARAADNLDRLIGYLRAALPRLRERGSTIEAELALVRAYLEVVTALHDGRPRLSIRADETCLGERFFPMLLLPLVQRAVRHPDGRLPDRIAFDVRREAGFTTVELSIGLAGGCTDDEELARVRERLGGLYGNAARLDCAEPDGQGTRLSLRLPVIGDGGPGT